MKDDYLWDRTGEPDPDVQSLESILGNLRHKGKAPEMPAPKDLCTMSASRPKIFFKPLLAAAAVLLMMLTALSLWLVINRARGQQSAQPQTAREGAPPAPKQSFVPESPGPQKEVVTPEQDGVKQLTASDNPVQRQRRSKLSQRENRSARERENREESVEGRIAKERLIKALQITSSTLNFAQKKTRVEKELDPPS